MRASSPIRQHTRGIDLDGRFVDEVREMLVPGRQTGPGTLPALLLALTFVTGLVDALSYLLLGHVFVANMTGNVAFLGFAFAGASGFSITASLVALSTFVVGALAGATLVLAVHLVAPLAIALVVTAAVALISYRSGAADPPWVRPKQE